MQSRSVSIDALRGVAILAVLQLHLFATNQAYRFLDLPQAVQQILGGGRAGVDLFFVLSAYLLTNNLIKHRDRAGLVPTFYLRRVFRIIPMYWLLLATGFALSALWTHADLPQRTFLWHDQYPLWTYLLFLQNWATGFAGVPVAHYFAPTWSLAVEEHFYLLLPLLATRLQPRALAALAVVWVVTALPIRMALESHVTIFAPYYFTIARLDSFGWGILIALTPQLWPQLVGRFDRRLCLVIGALIYVDVSLLSTEIKPGVYEMVGITTLTALASAILTFGVVHGAQASTSEGRLTRFLAWFGARCYSLYLVHMPVLGLTFLAAGRLWPGVESYTALALCAVAAALTLIVASVCYRRIELPFIAMAERLAPYSKTREAQAPAQVA